MNCQEYLNLDHQERFILIGQIVHLVQNDSDSFIAVSSMIRSARQQGKLDNVKIGPPERLEDSEDSLIQ